MHGKSLPNAINLGDFVSPSVLADAQNLRLSYINADPYPHVVIDNFLQPQIMSHIANNFPKMDQMPSIFREPMSYKGQLSDIDGKWPQFSRPFKILQSKVFRDFMTTITGIENLHDDPILAGGGLHQSPKSGFLDIHVDANFHPQDKALHRRINLLVYANSEWDPRWGGQLQLWSNLDNKPHTLKRSIEPAMNRAVIFSTTRTSWHGVAPISCPPDRTRRSLALYYYTDVRPAHELYRDSSVIWMNKTVAWKRVIYPAMNLGIAMMKPYAKTMRKLLGRDKFFDATKEK